MVLLVVVPGRLVPFAVTIMLYCQQCRRRQGIPVHVHFVCLCVFYVFYVLPFGVIERTSMCHFQMALRTHRINANINNDSWDFAFNIFSSNDSDIYCI